MDEKCSFCGKSEAQVEKMIAGPGVYICNECVGLCVEIMSVEGIELSSEPVVTDNEGNAEGGWRAVTAQFERTVVAEAEPDE